MKSAFILTLDQVIYHWTTANKMIIDAYLKNQKCCPLVQGSNLHFERRDRHLDAPAFQHDGAYFADDTGLLIVYQISAHQPGMYD